MRETVAGGGRLLFVGTKRQATEPVATAAKRCAQYFVNHRWLGGTLTNWQTITGSLKRLRSFEETLASAHTSGLTKKELLQMMRERDKLERSLGGIKDMGGLPSMLFVIDTNKESIAIAEARKLGIPVAAILDSNSNPDGITYPIPGNDDAARAIAVYCDLVARAILDGLSASQIASGVDIGEAEAVVENLPLPGSSPEAAQPAAE
jgi:small subunit ribosomal protein S2